MKRSTNEFYDPTKTWFQATPDETVEDLENIHIGAVPDSDELSEASAVSSSDETVKVSNAFAPATAALEGEPLYLLLPLLLLREDLFPVQPPLDNTTFLLYLKT